MEKCLNPNCNLPHHWDKKEVKTFMEAICTTCRAQLAAINVCSEESYEKLKIFFLMEFDKILKN